MLTYTNVHDTPMQSFTEFLTFHIYDREIKIYTKDLKRFEGKMRKTKKNGEPNDLMLLLGEITLPLGVKMTGVFRSDNMNPVGLVRKEQNGKVSYIRNGVNLDCDESTVWRYNMVNSYIQMNNFFNALSMEFLDRICSLPDFDFNNPGHPACESDEEDASAA